MSVVLMNPEIDLESIKRRMIEFTQRSPTEADRSGKIEIMEVAPRIGYIVVRPSYLALKIIATINWRLDTFGGLLWIAWLRHKYVYVHDTSCFSFGIHGDQLLRGQDELPEFEMSVRELFEGLEND